MKNTVRQLLKTEFKPESEQKPQLPAQAYKLYDKYAHGMLSRRDFFSAMAGLAVNAALAATFINSMLPNYALAQQVSFNDDDITASYQKFTSPQGYGEGRGYLVKPKHLTAAATWLKQLEGGNGKLGVVGFCFGGSMTGRLAAELPEAVNAAVPFYGAPPAADSIVDIKAPMLIQLAELDERVNQQWPAAEALFKQHSLNYKIEMYLASHHGFHNDSTARYNKPMADLAWQRTLTFFQKHLN